MDVEEQRRLLDAIVAAASAEECLVAPVGSVYFLLRDAPRQLTKDTDAVIHGKDLEPVSLATLQRIAARLGDWEVTVDQAVVKVQPKGGRMGDIELIRGRSAAKGGFFPRELLRKAAAEAERRGSLLIYPLEYILVLKAEAAIDREERAARDGERAEKHRQRAQAFRADVFQEVNAAMLGPGLDPKRLAKAVSCLKKSRQEAVRAMLTAAGAP